MFVNRGRCAVIENPLLRSTVPLETAMRILISRVHAASEVLRQ
jgi:hypothetical protein